MSLPYDIEQTFSIERIDPTRVNQARTFYYSDASTIVRNAPNANSVIDYDDDAIMGQVEMVLGTAIGSEENEPTFGSEVPFFKFDTLNNANLNLLEMKMISALRTWLGSRATFSTIQFAKDQDRGDVIATIPFTSKFSGRQYSYATNLTQMAKGAA